MQLSAVLGYEEPQAESSALQEIKSTWALRLAFDPRPLATAPDTYLHQNFQWAEACSYFLCWA